MSPLTFVALAVTLTLQAAVPQQAAVSGIVFEAGSNMPPDQLASPPAFSVPRFGRAYFRTS